LKPQTQATININQSKSSRDDAKERKSNANIRSHGTGS
jgi:hypothetical protein